MVEERERKLLFAQAGAAMVGSSTHVAHKATTTTVHVPNPKPDNHGRYVW